MKKKILSVLLSLAMVMSLVPMTMTSVAAADWTARTNEVDLRIGLLGDSHIQNGDSVADPSNDGGVYWVTKAIAAHKALGANQLDGLAMTGDIVYQTNANYENHYDQLNTMLAEYGEDFPMVFAMGNHEYPLNAHKFTDPAATAAESQAIFKEKMGLELRQHQVIGGYDFFAANAENYDGVYSDDTQAWVMAEVDKVLAASSTNSNGDGTFADGVVPDSEKPVFVILHHPVDGTIYGNTYEGYNDTFEAWIRNRPQVINLTAHMHVATELPQSVYQDGFTAFHTPLTSIGSNTVGGTTDADIFEHHGSMLEVKDGVVSIVRYNLENNSYIGEPWTIDVPAIVKDMTDADETNDYANQLYSADKRENTAKPVWGADAEITIKKRSNGATIVFPNNATVAETPNQQDGFIRAYRVHVKDTNGNTIINTSYANDYWNNPQQENIIRPLSGLGYGNTYTVDVYPRSPFLVEGDPISATFTTRAETISTQSQRFEAEDSVSQTGLKATTTSYASGGKMLASVEGGMIPEADRQRFTSDPSYNFEVTIPKDDTYTVEWAAGYNTNTTNLSKITITATAEGGEPITIGTSTSSTYIYDDLSMGSKYVWGTNLPLKKMRNAIAMTAGTYTINVQIDPRKSDNEVWLFALDYIQFTPQTFDLPEGQTEASLIRDENGVIDGVSLSSGSENSEGDITGVGSLENIIDGVWEGKTIGAQWYSKWNQSSPYFQVDLGKAKHISQIIYRPFNNVDSGGAYWRNKFEIQASNYADFRDYEVLCVQESAIDIETNFVLKVDPTVTKYRYVRVQRLASIADQVIGAREIDILGYEGEDTTIKTDLVESVSIANGTNGLTNVKNARPANPWSTAVLSTVTYQGGKPIEIQFTDDTDMSLVNTSTVKLSRYDGSTTRSITYNPIIDTKNKTLKIDLSDLADYTGSMTQLSAMYYTLDITSGIMSEDMTFSANPVSIKFTTGQIAKLPYVEGKEIKNIAYGKSARFMTYDGRAYKDGKGNVTLGVGRYTSQYTDGTVGQGTTTEEGAVIETSIDATKVLKKANPVLIDLGATYKIEGMAFVTKNGKWTYDGIYHYVLNEPTYDITGLTPTWNSGDVSSVFSTAKGFSGGFTGSVKLSSPATGRYLLVYSSNTVTTYDQYPDEIMAYAYVDAAADNDAYFTSPATAYTAETEETPYSETVTITAKAADAGTSTLILAEYNADGTLAQTIKSAVCTNGKATLSYTKAEGKTYKLFLWNSIEGMKPVVDNVEY